MDFEALVSFWGKTWKASANASTSGAVADPSFKPVIHHLFDVAAVALAIQQSAAARLARDAEALEACPEALARTRAFLVGLHDLGKFSRAFQSLAPEHWPEEVLGRFEGAPSAKHWVLTGQILQTPDLDQILVELFPNLSAGAHAHIGFAVGGHHGQPPTAEQQSALTRRDLRASGMVGPECLSAAVHASRCLRGVLEPAPLGALKRARDAQRFSWSLAGLTTLADWVGSDAELFPFEPLETELDIYWATAQSRALEAIEQKGLRHAAPAEAGGLIKVFPAIANTPRPMQRTADELALPPGPMMAIIEDATGSGKTEAALALASRMIADGRAEGVFFALPTMATANAMFDRLRDAHKRLFVDKARPSLALAHGRSLLSEAFAEVRLARGSPSQTGSVAAQCAEWIADDRRKAFFAEVGAGTIDQALLSVLPKKFLALRQFGLAGRVLIVDEAHAFDAYMSSELARLLQFHAAAGGSAIVLSATLPRAKRRELVAAFQSGLDIDTTVDLSAENYPLLTVVGKTGVQEDGIEDRADGARAVAVERLGDEPAAIERALSAAASGAAVLWVRNAVDDARDAYDQLSERWERVELFHARFAMCDRQRIETSVVERYGKSGDEEARHGRILVATQVVEQSLDLDFDLVISDLAPVDLIIQRVGRLWRHMDLRPASTRPIQGPRLLLLSPDPDDVRCPAWQHEIQAKGGYVYPNAGVLWRSAKTLFDAQEIRAPEGLRSLIEFAYGTQEIPEPLRDAEKRAQGDDYAAAFLADTNLVSLDDGYAGMREIHSDQEIGTRLGRPTATLRLARNVDGKLQPWAETDSLTRSWALSEVSVDARWLGDLETPLELTALVDEVRSNWAEWDRSVVAVVNDTEISLETASGDRPLRYELTQGLWRLSVDRKH